MPKIDTNKNKEKISSEGFVLLSDVEKQGLTPYTADYLSLRIRQGKLKGEKFGRSWYTKPEWLDEYMGTHASQESIQAHTQEETQSAVEDYDYGIPEGYEIEEFTPTKVRKPFKLPNISRKLKNIRGGFIKFKNKIFKNKNKDFCS